MQQVIRQGRAAIDRLPAVLAQVQRALDHAGLADTFRLITNLDLESATAGAKSYPENSAQHHALWAAIMAAMIQRKPLEADRYINSAETCAELALAAPVAEPTQTGVKAVQETTGDDGAIGLRLCGYASRFGEVDLQGEVMRKGAFAHIQDEWGAAVRPPVFLNHGFDDLIGFRPIGECTGYKVDDMGLHVDVWVPREPDPKRFSGAVLGRFKDVYARIAAGKTAGLSVGGAYAPTGRGIKRWNMSELSIVDRPCLPSATFLLRH
jgi:HK97 family phage prohead protease